MKYDNSRDFVNYIDIALPLIIIMMTSLMKFLPSITPSVSQPYMHTHNENLLIKNIRLSISIKIIIISKISAKTYI